LDSTQVVGAPTPAAAAMHSSIVACKASASHGARTKEKLNAVCSSSGRVYRASRCGESTHASATNVRSTPYASLTDRHPR
jgi:hypothetical protein